MPQDIGSPHDSPHTHLDDFEGMDDARYDATPEDAVYDAIYEDVDDAMWSFEVSPLDSVPLEDPQDDDAAGEPIIQIGDPFDHEPTGDGLGGFKPVTDFDPDQGFKIGVEEPAMSTALAPIKPSPLPEPKAGFAPAIPPPAVPPRVQARFAFREKADALFRHRKLAIGTVLFCLISAFLISIFSPKKYESYSVVLINTTNPTEGQQSISADFVDVPGLENRKVLNQALILQQAPIIAERTAERLLLESNGGENLTFADEINGEVTAENVADYLQEGAVSVEPAGEEVDAIRVTATTSNPEEAARLATIYTEEYARLTRETGRERITATRVFLEEQVARREGELDEIEHQIADYTSSERAVALDAQTQTAISQIATLQASLDQARIESRMREATLRSLQGEMTALQPRMAARAASTTEAEINQLDSQITELERVIEQIYLRNPNYRGNPDAHPDLRELDIRLSSLRSRKGVLASQLASEVADAGGVDLSSTGTNGQSFVADLRQRIASERAALDGARAESSALSSRLAEASGVLTTIPEQSRELAQLERSRAATEQLHAYLTTKLQQASVAEETEFGIAQVIREPQVPRSPSSPNLLLNLFLGGLLGLLLGLAATTIRFRTDGTIHTPSDLEDHGFKVVGTVPRISEDATSGTATVDGIAIPKSLVALTSPFTPAAEAFRHVHAALQGGPSAPQAVLVSSPEVGSGKSFVAANIAVAAAQADRKVLLIDADLRRPSVHDYLGLGAAPALGEGIDSENLIYWNTVVPGLFALTVREPANAPEDLWSADRTSRLLAGMRTTFDLIVIDAPPALVAADAAILAPHCDAALLVASAEKTHADAMTQVASELSCAGLSQIGSVLNRFDPEKSFRFKQTLGYRYSTNYAADRLRENSLSAADIALHDSISSAV